MTSHSEFGARTEGQEVTSVFADQIEGKTILITGVGLNGHGGRLAHELAAKNPHLLILTGRSIAKVQRVVGDIKASYPNVETNVLEFDVSSFESVRAAAAEVNKHSTIDILINNAGVMSIPQRTVSVDGYEMHLATNYLGAFLFTNLIMDRLSNAGGARIVNVSSNSYALSPFRFSDYNFEGGLLPEKEYPSKTLNEAWGLPWGLGYLPEVAYGQSKTALMLYSIQLSKGLTKKGVTIVSVNPGTIATDLWRYIPKEEAKQLFTRLPTKTLSQGVSTALVAAFDPALTGTSNIYLENCQVQKVLDFASDSSYAENLWKVTEDIVKQAFTF